MRKGMESMHLSSPVGREAYDSMTSLIKQAKREAGDERKHGQIDT